MKLHALCASAVALTLAFASPASAEINYTPGPSKSLDNNTVGFVVVATASAVLVLKCGYESAEGNQLRRAADRMGIDFDRYGPAVFSALMVIAEKDYDRELLIPDVTVTVRWTLDAFFKEYNANQRNACAKWAEAPLNIGVIHK